MPPTDRVVNFSPGPGVLPLPVLEQERAELPSIPGVGASAFEVSHRGEWFEGVIADAEANLRSLLRIGDDHRVLFCQGGASMQFAMVPMNLLRGGSADHIVTGSWGVRAAAEGATVRTARIAWTGEPTAFVRTPADDELLGPLDPAADYVHITSNETIQGVEYPGTPALPDDVLLVADASSDFLSRPLDVGRYGVIFAGAQKNAGPAGVTIVIVRDDVLGRIPDGLPKMLDYRTYAEHGSLYNTPPVFAIYVVGLVTGWLREEIGGVHEMERINTAKAQLLYDAIDDHPDVFHGHAEPASRSKMNVTFRLRTPEDEAAFLSGAAKEDMVELRGHRSVGGIRASIYNAMPVEEVERLADFMRRFAAR